MNTDLAKFIEAAIEESRKLTEHLPKPIMALWVSGEGDSVDLMLDNTRDTYSDWIPGEGADIGLTREQETKRVYGAHLPLYAKSISQQLMRQDDFID